MFNLLSKIKLWDWPSRTKASPIMFYRLVDSEAKYTIVKLSRSNIYILNVKHRLNKCPESPSIWNKERSNLLKHLLAVDFWFCLAVWTHGRSWGDPKVPRTEQVAYNYKQFVLEHYRPASSCGTWPCERFASDYDTTWCR